MVASLVLVSQLGWIVPGVVAVISSLLLTCLLRFAMFLLFKLKGFHSVLIS